MSAKDARDDLSARDEMLRHALIQAKELKDDADRLLEGLEATQFERGYN
jgi:hypothetical protein